MNMSVELATCGTPPVFRGKYPTPLLMHQPPHCAVEMNLLAIGSLLVWKWHCLRSRLAIQEC